MANASDGVNREGLDFRAGWVEALQEFLTRMQCEMIRSTKKTAGGIELAHDVALKMRKNMLDKMRSRPAEPDQAEPANRP